MIYIIPNCFNIECQLQINDILRWEGLRGVVWRSGKSNGDKWGVWGWHGLQYPAAPVPKRQL